MAHERLNGVGVRTLGAVLAGVPARSYAYKYGGYYYNDGNGREDDSGSDRQLVGEP